MVHKKIYIGAHTSIAGGVHHALLHGKEIGATTIQLFTANQRQWKSKEIPQEEIDLWHKTRKETGLDKIMSHDSYLINLGSPDPENLAKSRTAFKQEIKRCLALDLTFLNFHPGASVNDDRQVSLDRVVESLLEVRPLVEESGLTLLIETTAGQGSSLGWNFEEIGYLTHKLKGKLPIGVCIDTCHIFVAGYDIRSEESWNAVLKQFDEQIGLSLLNAFHMNDSVHDIGSKKDRHADIGEGKIGLESFKVLMTHPKTKWIPKYLETPGGHERWTKDIHQLKAIAEGA